MTKTPTTTWALIGLLTGLLTGLLLGGLPAQAERRHKRAEEKARAQAEELLQQGTEALGARDLPRAEELLQKAYRVGPSPEGLYRLGLLAEARGDVLAAHDAMRRFLGEEEGAATPEQRARAEQILALVRPPGGELAVLGARRALVLVGERPVGVLPLSAPLLLPAGSHQVVLESESQRLKGTVQVQAGRLIELRFDVGTGLAVTTVPPAILIFAQYTGSAPAEAQRLHSAIEQAVRVEGHAALDMRTVVPQSPDLAQCLGTSACQLQLSARNGVESMIALAATVSPLPPSAPAPTVGLAAGPATSPPPPAAPLPPPPRDYRFLGSLLDTAIGDVAHWIDKRCVQCTPQQAAAALSEGITELLRKGLVRPRGTLAVRTVPPGAMVFLDARPLGRAPLQVPAWAGPHEVRVEQSELLPESAKVVIEEGQATALDLSLKPLPKRKMWAVVLGSIAIGVGGLALTAGSVELLGISSCTNCASDIALTTTSLILGGAATAGGIVLLVKYGKRPVPPAPTSAPTLAPPPAPAVAP